MKNILTATLTALGFLLLFGTMGGVPTQAQEPPPPEIVPINGTAYWATEPTEPDFGGVQLSPFQADNPTREIWQATQVQNWQYLRPEVIPQNIQVSYSGIISGASNFVNDFSEVMLAIDPTDPNHLLGASKFFYSPATYGFYTGVFESYDGGYTWSMQQPPGVENYSLTSDPVTTFDNAGNGYFTLLTRGPTGLDMLKKPVGSYWEPPVVVDRSTYTDKQWIIGDQDPQGSSPYAGYLYMSWTDVGTSRIVFARSTDGNQTWSSPPIQLTSSSVQGSIPGVAPDGTVYVVYGRSIFSVGSGSIEFVKSSNGGVSFSAPAVAANISPIPFYLPDPFNHSPNFRSPASLPAFAVSPVDGNLYIAWADYRNGDADIYFARSINGGTNWSIPMRLNDDPLNNGIDQWQPQISVAPNGRVAVMWFDRRLDCPNEPWIPAAHVGVSNACIDTFMTRSFDEGLNWVPNIRASAQTWDWTLNLPITSGGDGFIGDYQGIASSNNYDYPFWNATANFGENPNNYQEIFIALVPVVPRSDLSASSKQVTPTMAQPGEVLSYTLTLSNTGGADANSVMVTDTLPISTTYLSGSLDYPHGSGGYNPFTHVITWTGWVSMDLAIEITYQLTTPLDTQDGILIDNSVLISEAHNIHTRTATAIINSPPSILATMPMDGATSIPITTSLQVTFSESMNPASLGLVIEPNPGSWTRSWNPDQSVLSINLPVLTDNQTYTVTVQANDQQGSSLISGLAPNPWMFSTENLPPMILSNSPLDSATNVSITTSLQVTFSESMAPTSLALVITPNPGSWTPFWDANNEILSITLPTLAFSQTYTVTLSATDIQGANLVSGPVPNPWVFTTEIEVPSPEYKIFLPLMNKP